jgi:hypothetical protein
MVVYDYKDDDDVGSRAFAYLSGRCLDTPKYPNQPDRFLKVVTDEEEKV